MKVAIYVRVSTRDKQDISKQRDFLVKYVQHQQNWEIFKSYEDKGISGAKAKRPALDAMLKDIDDWDVCLVYKLDRIGRSMKHLNELMDLFKAKNKAFASATQSIDTSKPEGRLFFNMLASFSEFEREMTIQRINDSLAAAKSRGVKLGRKKGAKDKRKRSKAGYYLRWQREREQRAAETLIPKNEIERQMEKTK